MIFGLIIDCKYCIKNNIQVKKKLVISFFLIFIGLIGYGQSFKDDVYRLVRGGKVDNLTALFNDPINLKVNSSENICSVNQAKGKLQTFFSQNPPSSFMENFNSHTGNEESSIGTYQSTNKKFYRIFFLYKEVNGRNKIFQFFIEPDKTKGGF